MIKLCVSYVLLTSILLVPYYESLKSRNSSFTDSFVNLTNFRRRTTNHIIPGTTNNSKYFASIFVQSVHICCGAYTGPGFVLTAAQCVALFPPKEVLVVMGSLKADGQGGKFMQVKNIHVYERYSDNPGAYDIALLELDRPFVLDETVAVVTIATELHYENAKCYVVGWGLTLRDGEFLNTSAPIELTSIVMEQTKRCGQQFKAYNVRIDKSVICVDTDFDACMADCGMALMCDDQMVGTSSLLPLCGSGLPIIFTSVPYYYKWLMSIMQKHRFQSIGNSLRYTNLTYYMYFLLNCLYNWYNGV